MTTRLEDLNVWPQGRALFLGRKMTCAVGRGGVSSSKREGDGATPAGRFELEFGFFRADRLRSPISSLRFTPTRSWMGWSDDPSDPSYNQLVPRPRAFGHERMMRPDALYDLVVVFSANRDPVCTGAGSALFLHLWRRPRFPTAGCVAFAWVDLLWIAQRWTARSRLILHPGSGFTRAPKTAEPTRTDVAPSEIASS